MLYETPWFVDGPANCIFYHTMDIAPFGLQKGQWDLRGKFNDYIGGLDLRGKRVLDIGTASGFLAFSAEEAGAREVVAFDMDTAERQHLMPFAGSRYVVDHAAWAADQNRFVDRWKRAFWLVHQARNSKVKVHYGDVYHLDPATGSFDVVIVGAVLEHLRDPFAALTSIAARAAGTVVINAAMSKESTPLARFAGRADNPEQNYTWWVWSKGMYEQALGILGFQQITMTDAEYFCELTNAMDRRTAIVARRS